LNSQQAALARHHTYKLLSRIFLEGVSAEIEPFLEQIPTIAPYLELDDDPAAVHYALFQYDIFPYESIFRDTTGLVGGAVTESVSEAWRSNGLTPPTEPDHIGHELALLAFLCGAESDAWIDQLAHTALQMRARQHAVLTEHLLQWLPAFVLSLQQSEQPLYAASARVLWDVVAEHRVSITVHDQSPTDTAIPAKPDLLTSDKTGVKDVVRFLVTPDYSGVWFGRKTITDLARRHNLPRGFGGRISMFMTLFRSAAQYDGAVALSDDLAGMVGKSAESYKQLINDYPDLGAYITPWHTRANQTADMLQEMRDTIDLAVD
jgi:TorA maturation chaperone TorD